ncbi:MAG: homoserine kinase [Candidatus Poribacteria bacterium]|nr:homoserine kinase [Candidatus Poribacteria bacterium]MDE0502709.1 homoserine kinase [Candidatus Poribacteria bacterium]
MSRKAIARVPASTTNLGPGFDVLGLALQLYSTVELEETGSGREVVVSGIDANKIPSTSENISLQAAELVFERSGNCPKGLRLVLTNGIPALRGLGGSGTAILGGLLTANALCGEPFSQSELLNFACEIEGHPDNVAASLLGGFVVSVTDSDVVHTIKLDCASRLQVVVAIPDFPISTKDARQILPKSVEFKDAAFNVSRSSLLVAAVATGNFGMLSEAMDDRLHQPYRIPLISGFDEIAEAAKQAGALSVALSGAGPTVAAYCISAMHKVAEKMSQAFARHEVVCDVKILSIDTTGATVQLIQSTSLGSV